MKVLEVIDVLLDRPRLGKAYFEHQDWRCDDAVLGVGSPVPEDRTVDVRPRIRKLDAGKVHKPNDVRRSPEPHDFPGRILENRGSKTEARKPRLENRGSKLAAAMFFSLFRVGLHGGVPVRIGSRGSQDQMPNGEFKVLGPDSAVFRDVLAQRFFRIPEVLHVGDDLIHHP